MAVHRFDRETEQAFPKCSIVFATAGRMEGIFHSPNFGIRLETFCVEVVASLAFGCVFLKAKTENFNILMLAFIL
jgi:hypothetical protein